MLKCAYYAYVRPLLEYCSPVCNPYHVQDINNLEKVQKYFTRRLFSLCNFYEKDYTGRLADLKMEQLYIRRLRADLILCFQIVRGFVASPIDSIFSPSHVERTRGHLFKLIVNYWCKKKFLCDSCRQHMELLASRCCVR